MVKSLSIIIPAYNEEQNLVSIFDEICRQVNKLKLDYEIIIVDDGSQDSTWEIAKKLSKGNTRVIRHESNKGSGMDA